MNMLRTGWFEAFIPVCERTIKNMMFAQRASASRLRFVAVFAGTLAVFSAAATAHAQTTTDQLFISHYQASGGSATFRYNYSQTGTVAPTFTENEGTPNNATPFLSGSGASVTEGTSASQNQIFGVGGSGNNVIYVYDKANKTYRGSITGFGSIGNIALSNDGKYLYVADETNASLEVVDLNAIGSSRSTVSINDTIGSTPVRAARDTTTRWHDIFVDSATGNIYASGYSDTNKNIYKFTSSLLAGKTQFNTAAIGTGGITGMTIVGSDFYAVNNRGDGVNGALLKFGLNGVQDTNFNVVSKSLAFGFGLQRGPDSNLYVASLSGYSNANRALDTSNISQVIINPAKTYGGAIGSVKEVVSSTVNAPVASPNGSVDPKYFVFGTANAIAGNTIFGTTVIPESNTLLLGVCGLFGLVAVQRRRAKK